MRRFSLLLLGLCALIALPVLAATQTWVEIPTTINPPQRNLHGMAYAANHQVVVFAGYGIATSPTSLGCCYADTWIWNGVSWAIQHPLTSPSARYLHAMAYDAAHDEAVMFGGYHLSRVTPFAETWVWDGTDWILKTPSTIPPARERTALAYDPIRGEIVMFGGTGAGVMSDTWIWNGTNWVQKFPVTVPPARFHHAMAFDEMRGEIVMFGGYKSNNLPIQMLDDTWVWNGTNWTQKSAATSPTFRAGHGMAYANTSQGVLLFGGEHQLPNGSGVILQDTWIWNGSNWVQQYPTTSPPVKGDVRLVLDPYRDEVLMFGKEPGFTGTASDTWIWRERRTRRQITSQ